MAAAMTWKIDGIAVVEGSAGFTLGLVDFVVPGPEPGFPSQFLRLLDSGPAGTGQAVGQPDTARIRRRSLWWTVSLLS